jgi:hypothetical protein
MSLAPKSWLIHPGDSREVKEIPQRVSATTTTNTIYDIIHDDVTMEREIFANHLKTVVPSLSAFNSPESLSKIPRENYVLFPRIISGFVLSSRKWVNLEMQKMQRATFNKDLWRELQLPNGYKKALLATVRNHIQTNGRLPEYDSIPGKGAGVIILLQGHPGTGKTFTAEALAAFTNRTLYSITSGELGETVSGIETQLRKILERGRKWGCVILLDEADVYLTKRGQDTLERNSIVSVFLRMLEYYPGIMILTSNRSLDLDEALVSRFHLRLIYPPLNREAVRRVWNSYCSEKKIQQFVADHGAGRPRVTIADGVKEWWVQHYDKATQNPGEQTQEAQGTQASQDTAEQEPGKPWWSGRDIQFAFRHAVSLAVYEKMELKRKEAKKKVLEEMEKQRKLQKKREKKRQKMGEDQTTASMQDLDRPFGEAFSRPRSLTKDDELLVTTKHFDEVLSMQEDFTKRSQKMHDQDNAGVSTAAPDEFLHYDLDAPDEPITSEEESDTSSEGSDEGDECRGS